MRKLLLFVSIIASLIISRHANAQIVFFVENPSGLVGSYNFTYSNPQGWGADLDTVAITDTLVIIDDGTAEDSLGCNAAVNGAQIANNIAVVYRGSCEFGEKALRAQNAGAIAVVIINNIPGALVNMSAGAVGNGVTIPVVMISKDDGALFRSAIDAGQLIAFIGNKTGLFNNDLTISKKDIVMAHSFAIPTDIAQNNNDFAIPVGAWIYNYGINNQTNVTLAAEVNLGPNTLYSQASTGISINSGDSAFISLPIFSQSTYNAGFYNLAYTINSDSIDDFASDNGPIMSQFWINDSLLYSKSRFDSITLIPITTGAVRPSGATNEFKWCIVLDSVNASNLTAYGLSFSASTSSSYTLLQKSFKAELHQWNDDISTAVTFNSLVSVAEKDYFYSEDLQDEFVSVKFETPAVIQSNSRYLGCIVSSDDSTYIGYDTNLDYSTNYNNYNDAFFPLQTGTIWYHAGFGTDAVPAIIIHFAPIPVGIEEKKSVKQEIKPFPNPAVNNISIPLSTVHNEKIRLQVFDVTGKLVKSDVINMSHTNIFKVNTSSLESGAYFFHLRFEDKSESSFRVVINH